MKNEATFSAPRRVPVDPSATNRTLWSVIRKSFARTKFEKMWHKRNSRDAIKPFLLALESTDRVFNSYAFVLEDAKVNPARLTRLGFTREINDLMGSTLYNPDLNLAVTLVPEDRWQILGWALDIAEKCNYTEVTEEAIFKTAYQVLLQPNK